MVTKKKKATVNQGNKAAIPEFYLDVQTIAKSRGIPHAYGLWQVIGGSMESAADLWNGRTKSISFCGNKNVLGKLCAALQCTPKELIKELLSK